jgi:hypothetical protein
LIHARRTGVAAVVVLAALVGAPGSAQAQPPSVTAASATASDGGLPPGWRVTGEGAQRELVWRSERTVPMGDARVEFHAGDRLLGVPRAADDGRTFRLVLDQDTPLEDLRVLAAGRRLDARTDGPDGSGGSGGDGGSDGSGDGGGSGGGGSAAPDAGRLPAQPPANAVDPGKPGPYGTVSGEYDLPPVKLPGFAEPVEMQAVVVAPKGATGKRPLALFLHGRHGTCYKPGGDDVTGDWPCPAGHKAIPSYKGYLRDQKLLASQGYMTVSVSANGINGQDGEVEDGGAQARSSLVRQHLAKWADWTAHRGDAPAVVRDAPETDLSRVLLVGHSRGGEGVNRAAMDSLYPAPAEQDGYRGPVSWKIRGTVLIGPTIFGHNPVADVPSMTILPGCDGDVADLQGQVYVDGTRGVSKGSALHSAVYVVGANHNFFNSEWTPGQAEAPADDDFWEDPDSHSRDKVCSTRSRTRLTAGEQQKAGATYTAAAARLFVAGDDRVRPLLDGSNRRAPSADPARVLTHAVGARRTGGFLPDNGVKVTGGRLCAAVDPSATKACLSRKVKGASPHFAWWQSATEAGRSAVALKWSAAGRATKVTPAKPVSLSGATHLALRVIVPPNTSGTKLDVSVTDSAGRRAKLGRVKVDGLPGTARTASYWAREIRVPLTAAGRGGFDLKHVKSLTLTPRSRTGQAWMMDAWGWAPGTPAVTAAALPRVDIGRLRVKEGDSGTRTYRVPVTVSGHGSGKVRFSVPDRDTGRTVDKTVTVRPGASPIDVPVVVKGDTRFGDEERHFLLAKAVRGAVVGSYAGGVTVEDDDPAPVMGLKPVAGRVTEGRKLTWRVTFSAPAEVDVRQVVRVLPVTEGVELSTKDVDPRWLENFGERPSPERPLSQTGVWITVDVRAGRTTADFTVPTVKDRVTEPAESLRLALADWDGEPLPGLESTGTVVDAS